MRCTTKIYYLLKRANTNIEWSSYGPYSIAEIWYISSQTVIKDIFSFDFFWIFFSSISFLLPLELMQSQQQVPCGLYRIHCYCNLLAGPRTLKFLWKRKTVSVGWLIGKCKSRLKVVSRSEARRIAGWQKLWQWIEKTKRRGNNAWMTLK